MPLTDAQHAAVDTFLAKYAGEDAPLVKALLTDGELSTGDPTAVSPKGAHGLMQLTPGALEETGRDPKTFDYNNPAESLKAGTDYVRILRDKYGFTNPLQIAAAYNAGPSRVQAAVKAGSFKTLPAETQAYIVRMAKVLPGVRQATSAQAAETVPAPPADTVAPSDVEQPFVRPEDMSNVAPPQPPSMAKVIAGAPLRAGAGLVDLAAQGGAMLLSGPNSTPADFGVGSATNAVNQVVPPPATTGQTYADAAAQGATLGLPGGVPGVVIGAAGGVAAQAGADLFEKLGLPPVIGGLIGGGATGLVTGAGRFVGALKRGVTWEKAAERAAVTELKDATAALEDTRAASAARKTAALEGTKATVANASAEQRTAVANAQEAARTTVANAEDAQRLANTRAKEQVGATVRQAKREGAAAVSAAQQRIDRHAAIRAEVQANADQAVDQFLIQNKDPGERARMLQNISQGRRDRIHAYIDTRYTDFLKRADATGNLVKLAPIRQAAGGLVDDLAELGIPRDQASIFGERIMNIVDREAATFSEVQALRSSVGKVAAGAEGPAGARLQVLKAAIDDAMNRAIPENMQAEFMQLKIYRRAEGRLYQESFARKALGRDDAGRETATTFITNLLNGKWTPGKHQALREVMLGAGDSGREVLRDALVRQGMQQSSVNGIVDFTQLHRNLLNPEGLRPIARQLLSTDELRLFQSLSEDMTKATRAYDEAVAAYKPTVGSSRELVRGAKDTASAGYLSAREQSAAALRNTRSTEAQKLLTTRTAAADKLRSIRSSEAAYLRDVRREEAANVATARARLRSAQANVPDPKETVLAQVGSLVMQKPTLMRIIFQPGHRQVLRRAAHVYAGSLKGQEMIRLLVGGAAIGQEAAAGPGPSVPSTAAAPSAPGRP